MAAGHRLYSFDWSVFTDLTSNARSTIPAALAEATADPKTRKKLGLPAKLPKATDKLSTLIRDAFLKPEWYVDQPMTEVKLRHQLLMGMFFDKSLQSIGLSATPAWREFYECCSFDLGYCLAGRFALDLERMKRGKGAYYKILENAEPPDGNPFWCFGNRPYRYGGWQLSNEYDFEDEYEFALYSIHSPDDVNAMAGRLAEMAKVWEKIECKELQELLADYQYCIEGVRKKKAGMFVENDT